MILAIKLFTKMDGPLFGFIVKAVTDIQTFGAKIHLFIFYGHTPSFIMVILPPEGGPLLTQ